MHFATQALEKKPILFREETVMRQTMISAAIAISFTVLTTLAYAHKSKPTQHFSMGDLKLESGEVIKDNVQSFITHGTLNAKKSNVILVVPSVAGDHHRVDFLLGEGKALDPTKYFIVATDTFGNGALGMRSPSNSKEQPGLKFPKFTVRTMVESQRRLLVEKFGITHVVAVVGASMGGMQALQWGVSNPDFMDSLVAIAATPYTGAWTVALHEATRKALMADADWNNGNYTQQPLKGWRAWADIIWLAVVAPDGMNGSYPTALDVIPAMKKFEQRWIDAKWDANDWILRTWAYDRHNIGDTPGRGFKGDHIKALASIKAKTLLMSSPLDLYNPVELAHESAKYIPGATFVEIPTNNGHRSGKPADVDFQNWHIKNFLDQVTNYGKKLR